VTIPAVAPELPAVLVLTGNTLGTAEIHVSVGEFVRSRTYGGVENVPIARNCPVSCKFPTVIELGIMVSESRGCGGAVSETVTDAAPDTTLPSVFVNDALMVVVPALNPVTRPDALTEAMEELLEVHLTWLKLVTSCCSPVVPDVPSAINWLVWPDADSA
jgi:hypothetical protein